MSQPLKVLYLAAEAAPYAQSAGWLTWPARCPRRCARWRGAMVIAGGCVRGGGFGHWGHEQTADLYFGDGHL